MAIRGMASSFPVPNTPIGELPFKVQATHPSAGLANADRTRRRFLTAALITKCQAAECPENPVMASHKNRAVGCHMSQAAGFRRSPVGECRKNPVADCCEATDSSGSQEGRGQEASLRLGAGKAPKAAARWLCPDDTDRAAERKGVRCRLMPTAVGLLARRV